MLMEYNELTTLFWDMTAALVGDMVRKPAAKYIRYKYPVDGKPQQNLQAKHLQAAKLIETTPDLRLPFQQRLPHPGPVLLRIAFAGHGIPSLFVIWCQYSTLPGKRKPSRRRA